MKGEKQTETGLAQLVVERVKDMGFEVYQEVEGPGGRCDIVAVRGKIHWAIECKLSFGMAVMEQAYNWLSQGRAHYVSVATPSLHTGWLQQRICKDYGIGVIGVKYGEVREIERPRFNRRALGFKLFDQQKTFCQAGSNRGGHFTRFKWTVQNLVDKVHKQPGIEFVELIKSIDHHYGTFSTAKSCLREFIGTSVIPEIECRMVGKKLCVFPKEATI